eukprot:6173385-Pleurochrysis_carterae.AAC.1
MKDPRNVHDSRSGWGGNRLCGDYGQRARALHGLLHVAFEATRAQLLLKAQLCRSDERICAVPVLFLCSDTREQLLHR